VEFKAQKWGERGFRAADLDHDGRLDRKEYFAARSFVQQTRLGANFDDALITARVKALLQDDSFLTGLEIHVETRRGVVRLSGFVQKPEQIGRAISLASHVEGVKQVQNDLALKDAGQPPTASKAGHAPALLAR
jgi:hyperosmotically inducible periplasmic protein